VWKGESVHGLDVGDVFSLYDSELVLLYNASVGEGEGESKPEVSDAVVFIEQRQLCGFKREIVLVTRS